MKKIIMLLLALGVVCSVVAKTNYQTKILESNDNRSYHINSDKIMKNLNFEYKESIESAIYSLKDAFEKKILTNTFSNEDYFNIKKMQKIDLI